MNLRMLGAGTLALITMVMMAAFIIVIATQSTVGEVLSLPEIFLPLLVIVGVAGLLASLTVATVIITALNLDDRKQALGLPKGSVRALIALSLIIIFAITSTFLYRNLYYRVGPGGSLIPPSDEQVRFAQQILTTVSTLVVAVAGFYFGTRSVEAARGVVEKPNLRVVSPTSRVELAEGEKLTIKLETTPRGEAITWEIEGDPNGSLDHVDPYEFLYERGSEAGDPVTLRFALFKHPDVAKELKVYEKKKPSKKQTGAKGTSQS